MHKEIEFCLVVLRGYLGELRGERARSRTRASTISGARGRTTDFQVAQEFAESAAYPEKLAPARWLFAE